MSRRNQAILWLMGTLLWSSCGISESPYLLEHLPASITGIHFANTIQETDSVNILNFHYIYNGGGVGVGDFDQNGLPDLIFTGNQLPSKLYLNEGEMHFKDISEDANFHPLGWATGVSVVDINGDGWMDIYISVGGYEEEGRFPNQLFLHQGLDEEGVPFFQEMAASFGLADTLYTQQACFFDYDQDGDLDVYLLHNVIDHRDKNAPSQKHFISQRSMDQLMENDGQGGFRDVSKEIGIDHRGYGLGIAIDDFNQDGLPDVYVANDFLSDDLLYLNQGKRKGVHQGFLEQGKQLLKHTSYNAMGVDINDVNQDGLPDIFVLDMLPDFNERQKTMMGFMNYDKFLLSLRQGYSPQFVRNTLQLHNGFLNEEPLPFSEVAYLTGVHSTDWSWTPLLADLDNDGDRDLFVTNGYGKDITDLDFVHYSQNRSPFGTQESQQKELFEKVQAMSPITIPNYVFANNGLGEFQHKREQWMKSQPSISSGAAYADLDQDGDLDLIVNNLNEPAYILQNRSSEQFGNHSLRVKLEGPPTNPTGIGTRLTIWIGGKLQTQYQNPVRGYLSSVESIVHFGVGPHPQIDSLVVQWPDGKRQTLMDIQADQILLVQDTDASHESLSSPKKPRPIFQNSSLSGIIQHQENVFQDFDAQPLLLHQHSRQGPCFAVAELDGKAGDELFVGGAKGYPGRLFTQIGDTNFHIQYLAEPSYEDTDAAFFDLDQDGDLDLYVVSGGTESGLNSAGYQDRLYINHGNGQFAMEDSIHSPATTSGSCVHPMDFDKDGDVDVFVGGRIVPGRYPESPRSYLLRNESGRLVDRTDELAPQLRSIGMVSDAVWSDINQDGWEDLILVGECMTPSFLKNKQGKLVIDKGALKGNASGFWNSITQADLDQDGDEDFVLGNLGRNSRLQASESEPISLFVGDFDQNGSIDPLIGHFEQDQSGVRKNFPLHARDDVFRQLVQFKTQYLTYAEFGSITFPELLDPLQHSENLLALTHLTSSILRNQGNGQFSLESLPIEAQRAPIQDVLAQDFNKDGLVDLLLVGNDFTAEKNHGWYDGFNGLMLKGKKDGTFESLELSESGFFVPKDAREIVPFQDWKGIPHFMVGQNSAEALIFTLQSD